jgi:hypothetical protein
MFADQRQYDEHRLPKLDGAERLILKLLDQNPEELQSFERYLEVPGQPGLSTLTKATSSNSWIALINTQLEDFCYLVLEKKPAPEILRLVNLGVALIRVTDDYAERTPTSTAQKKSLLRETYSVLARGKMAPMIAEGSTAFKLLQSVAEDFHECLKHTAPETRAFTLKAFAALLREELACCGDNSLSARRRLGEARFDAAFAPMICNAQNELGRSTLALLREATGIGQVVADFLCANEHARAGHKTFANQGLGQWLTSGAKTLGMLTELLHHYNLLAPHFKSGTTPLAIKFSIASLAAWQSKYDPRREWSYGFN